MGVDFKKTAYRNNPASKQQAVDRLRLILTHDRVRLSPGFMGMLKEEIIAAISKHVEIDEENIEIELTSSQNRARLVASIPVNKVRRVSGDFS